MEMTWSSERVGHMDARGRDQDVRDTNYIPAPEAHSAHHPAPPTEHYGPKDSHTAATTSSIMAQPYRHPSGLELKGPQRVGPQILLSSWEDPGGLPSCSPGQPLVPDPR